MTAKRRCWWCGTEAEVDLSLPESGGLIRDDSTMDGSESWICTDNDACNARSLKRRAAKRHLADCARVYLRTGKIAHLLPPGASPNLGYPVVLCGRQPAFNGDWLGTGSQNEHEQAAALPLCSRCEYLANERNAA